MASLRFMLGMIPGTEKVESADDKLRADFQAFREFENSDELKHFQELEKEVTSNDFAMRKRKILKEKYKASEEYRKEMQYKQMAKRARKGDEPEGFKELESYINSDEFARRKQYLTMKPRERYETTEEYRREKEYEDLKNSEKITWYFRTKKKYPFKEIERWEQTFDESFEGNKLDDKKWMTRYFWGDKILDSPYAMVDDKSFITDGGNIEFYDNKLHIVTRPEEKEGLQWNPEQGFFKHTFDYTSGLISTAKSFRQKYGIFKAKIKMAPSEVTQAFWMVSDTMVPHIDVAKLERGKFRSNFFWSARSGQQPSRSSSKLGGGRFSHDFYIFTLEWSPGKLVWKINDQVFKTQTSGVPQEEMYMVFSSALKEFAGGNGLPAAMEVDWVRVYKLKE